MDQRDCFKSVAACLGDFGILPGHTVLVHSAFKSLGQVPGGNVKSPEKISGKTPKIPFAFCLRLA